MNQSIAVNCLLLLLLFTWIELFDTVFEFRGTTRMTSYINLPRDGATSDHGQQKTTAVELLRDVTWQLKLNNFQLLLITDVSNCLYYFYSFQKYLFLHFLICWKFPIYLVWFCKKKKKKRNCYGISNFFHGKIIWLSVFSNFNLIIFVKWNFSLVAK